MGQGGSSLWSVALGVIGRVEDVVVGEDLLKPAGPVGSWSKLRFRTKEERGRSFVGNSMDR